MAYNYQHAGVPPPSWANTQIPPTPPFSPGVLPTPAVDAAALTAPGQPAYQAPQFAPPPPPPPKQSGGVLKTLNFFSSKPSYQQTINTGEGCLSNPTSPKFYSPVQGQTTGTTYGVTGGQTYSSGATVVPQQVYNVPQPQPQPQPSVIGNYSNGQGTVPVSPAYIQPTTTFPQQQQNQVPLYQPQSQQKPQQQYNNQQNNDNGVASPPAYSPAWTEKPQQQWQEKPPQTVGGNNYNPGAGNGSGPEKISAQQQQQQTWPPEKPQGQGNNYNQVNNNNNQNPGQHPAHANNAAPPLNQHPAYNQNSSPVHNASNTNSCPPHTGPPPAGTTKPSQPYGHPAHQNAPDSSAYWATLVAQGKIPLAPRPELRGLFRGIARCMNKECSVDSTPTCVLSPAKMSMYYGISPSYSSRESQFFARAQRAPSALVTLYNALSTEYLLIPAPPGDGRRKPHSPALTIAGFEHWLLINALINPDGEHARISAFLSKKGRVVVDDEGRVIPASGFPREALPGGPDASIVEKYRGPLETALGSANANEEVAEEEGWKAEIESWKKKMWESKGELEKTQTEVEEKDEELEECREELEGTQQELKGCRGELEKSREELKSRNAELESLRAALAESVKRADEAVSKLAAFVGIQQQQQQQQQHQQHQHQQQHQQHQQHQQQQQQQPPPTAPSYAPYQGTPSQSPQYPQSPQTPQYPANPQAPQYSHNPLAPQPPRTTPTPQTPQNPPQQQNYPQPGYPVHSNTWSSQSSGSISPGEDPARKMSASWGQPPQGQGQGQGQGQNRRISQTYVKPQYQPVRK